MAEGTLKDALVKCKNPEANFVLSSNQRIGIMKGKTWVLGQGNLVGLEGKAPGFFFFKSVNIWDRLTFYNFIWVLFANMIFENYIYLDF